MGAKNINPEERKAEEVLIQLRGYKLIKEEKHEDALAYVVYMPKEKEKALIWRVPGESTVGIASINRLQKAMKDADVERAIMVTDGRYTHAVKQGAQKRKIELLQRFPTFDLFKHALVPKHVILEDKEKEQLLTQLRVKPYQLPQISFADPVVKAIGAKPGDILRVVRKSPTAGEHLAYRYVVE